MEKEWREGWREVQQDGRTQSVAANGRGATCADGRLFVHGNDVR